MKARHRKRQLDAEFYLSRNIVNRFMRELNAKWEYMYGHKLFEEGQP